MPTGIQDFELLDSICQIVNHDDSGNDAAIAQYVISNIKNPNAITIKRIMGEAYVTRSSIRRFCNRLGYSSLTDLKDSLDETMFPSDLAHRSIHMPLEDYRPQLYKDVIEVLTAVDTHANNGRMVRLANDIARHEQVEFLCANNTTGNLQRFQQEMLYAGKVIRIGRGGKQEAASSNTENPSNTLIVVVSVSGLYARQTIPYLAERNARTILITAFCANETAQTFDEAVFMSPGGSSTGIDHHGLYAKYGITYFLDLLSECYLYQATLSH